MNYKLEHKTIGFGIDPRTRQPTQGIEGVFFIPSYQRGYRWTSDEVTKLLDDIWESAGQPYSLQPIVVQQKKDGGSDWALIDGQQRLTTLWLLLVPRRFVWNLTARIHRSGARWGLWATRQSELSTNPPGGAFC